MFLIFVSIERKRNFNLCASLNKAFAGFMSAALSTELESKTSSERLLSNRIAFHTKRTKKQAPS